MDKEEKKIYPTSVLMKIAGVEVKDLPVSKPTYYSMVYGTRKCYPQTYKSLATFFNIEVNTLKESLLLEREILEAKKK